MNKIRLKKFSLSLVILITIFLIDRLTKVYILKLLEVESSVDLYLTSYLNLYLIWNKGIAFGLFSVNESIIYNTITMVIGVIIIIICFMVWKNDNIKRYFLVCIAGGAIGNIYDRVVYGAVPDFIDLHIQEFHWFIFNVADIFITIGVFCLICAEIFLKNEKNEKIN